MSVLTISKILMPVDFSSRALAAARYAARLARHFHGELTLLHVLEPPHLDFAMVEFPESVAQLSKARCKEASARLERFANEDLQGLKVTRQISEGQPADVILAQSAHSDLVVMPTQGHGRVREFLIGSVTAKVLHDCARPVLTGVHLSDNSAPPDWHVKSVLCAVDLGPESDSVLRWGAGLAQEFGAAVTVIHADEGNVRHSGNPLDASLSILQAAGVTATATVIPGDPHRVITEAAERIGADVVVIGRSSSTGALSRLRVQGYQIVRKSPCPVLSV